MRDLTTNKDIPRRGRLFQMDMPQMGLQPEEPMFDGYTALAYMAAIIAPILAPPM